MLSTTDIDFDKKVQRTFALAANGKSGYYMKGTENNKIYMDHPGFMRLTPTSQVCLGKGRGNVKIQYVMGASTIFVDDLYQDEKGNLHPLSAKKKDGWELKIGLKKIYNLKEEYNKVVEMTPPLGFYNGFLTLDKWGDDPILLEFVKHHECNIAAPNAEHNKHPRFSQFNFMCLEEEKKAEEKLDTLDVEMEAKTYLSSLRTKKGEAYIFTQKDKNKIDATLRIFDLKPTFMDENYAQKLLLIKGYADFQPDVFVGAINNDFNEVKMNIAKAFALTKGSAILEHDKKESEFTLTINGKKRSILKLEGKTQDETIDELASWFLCLNGVTDYKDFIFALNGAVTGQLN